MATAPYSLLLVITSDGARSNLQRQGRSRADVQDCVPCRGDLRNGDAGVTNM